MQVQNIFSTKLYDWFSSFFSFLNYWERVISFTRLTLITTLHKLKIFFLSLNIFYNDKSEHRSTTVIVAPCISFVCSFPSFLCVLFCTLYRTIRSIVLFKAIYCILWEEAIAMVGSLCPELYANFLFLLTPLSYISVLFFRAEGIVTPT